MSIFLAVLGVIGRVLLTILIILLVIIALILFVPVHYEVHGKVDDPEGREKFDQDALLKELSGEFRFHWLFHLVSGAIAYPDETDFIVKILFFKINVSKKLGHGSDDEGKKPDNEAQRQLDRDLERKKEKEEEKSRKNQEGEPSKSEKEEEKPEDPKDKDREDVDTEKGSAAREEDKAVTDDTDGAAEGEDRSGAAGEVPEDHSTGDTEKKEEYDKGKSTACADGIKDTASVNAGPGDTAKSGETPKKKDGETPKEGGKDREEETKGKAAEGDPKTSGSGKKQDKRAGEEKKSGSSTSGGTSQKESTQRKSGTAQHGGAFGNENKIEALLEKIFEKLLDLPEILENKTDAVSKKIEKIIRKISRILDILGSPSTERAVDKIKKVVGKLLGRILPKSWTLEGTAGLGDPAAAGKLLGIVGMFYPVLGSHVKLTPEMELWQFDLELFMEGKVRIINIVSAALALLTDRDVRRLIRRIRHKDGGAKKKGRDRKNEKKKQKDQSSRAA